MKRYVLGFCIDANLDVLLIRKDRPEWQRGRLNGLGGHVEEGEAPSQAMQREFREETDDFFRRHDLPEPEWCCFARLLGSDYEVWVSYGRVPGRLPEGLLAMSVAEGVLLTMPARVACMGMSETLPSVEYLLTMALNHMSGRDHARFFDVVEREPPVQGEAPRLFLEDAVVRQHWINLIADCFHNQFYRMLDTEGALVSASGQMLQQTDFIKRVAEAAARDFLKTLSPRKI